MDILTLQHALAEGSLWRRTAHDGEKKLAAPEAAPARTLLVFVQGISWRRTTAVDYLPILKKLLLEDPPAALRGADLLPLNYESGFFSRQAPDDIARSLDERIQLAARDYKRIHVFAHSAGGLLVRAALVRSVQRTQNRPDADQACWRRKLGRCVFAATTHRGFIVQPKYWLLKIPATMALAAADLLNLWAIFNWCGWFRLLTAVAREGSWVGDLRLAWHWTFEGAGEVSPATVHLRGADDELLGPDDDAEPFCFPNSRTVKDVGEARHGSWANPSELAEQRLRAAFSDGTAGAEPGFHPPGRPELAGPGLKLAFVVHGIRDYGEWQRSIQREVEMLDDSVRVVKLRYGYFSAVQFAIPDLRQQSIRSFRLQYLEEVLARPHLRAENIAALGHSNGTYAVCEFLRRYPHARIGRLFLAAAVLPRVFPWRDLEERNGVARVHAECAAGDVPVGVLCNAISWMFFSAQSIGTAGYHGFAGFRTAADPATPSEPFGTNHFRGGGHGQVFQQPDLARRVAAFLHGGAWVPAAGCLRRRPSLWMRSCHVASYLALPALLALAFAVSFWNNGPHGVASYFWACVVALLFGLLAIKF